MKKEKVQDPIAAEAKKEGKALSSEGKALSPEESTPSLEDAFSLLEEITHTLEDEEITLEDSFQAYKKGMDLLKICNDKIDKVEKKVLMLNEEGGLDEF